MMTFSPKKGVEYPLFINPVLATYAATSEVWPSRARNPLVAPGGRHRPWCSHETISYSWKRAMDALRTATEMWGYLSFAPNPANEASLAYGFIPYDNATVVSPIIYRGNQMPAVKVTFRKGWDGWYTSTTTVNYAAIDTVPRSFLTAISEEACLEMGKNCDEIISSLIDIEVEDFNRRLRDDLAAMRDAVEKWAAELETLNPKNQTKPNQNKTKPK